MVGHDVVEFILSAKPFHLSRKAVGFPRTVGSAVGLFVPLAKLIEGLNLKFTVHPDDDCSPDVSPVHDFPFWLIVVDFGGE